MTGTVVAMDPLAGYRSEFTEAARFLNFAAVGPMSRRAINRLDEHVEMLALPDREPVTPLLDRWADAKRLGAELLGTSDECVTYVSSTSHGLFSTAFALAGGNVVIPANEFPANIYPWLRASDLGRYELRRVPIPDGRVTPERVARAVDAETRAVAVSAVGYTTGYRVDLASIREVAGDALVVVDAVQALGALRVDMSHADVVVAGSQKWMRAGVGSAILAVSERMLERHEPVLTGWIGVDDPFGIDAAPHAPLASADRYAMGSSPLMAVGAWRGALEVTIETGIDAIEAAVLERADIFEAALSMPGVELVQPGRLGNERSSIISFRTPGHDVRVVAKHLAQDGFVITQREGSDVIRIAPHATTPLTSAEDLASKIRASLT